MITFAASEILSHFVALQQGGIMTGRFVFVVVISLLLALSTPTVAIERASSQSHSIVVANDLSIQGEIADKQIPSDAETDLAPALSDSVVIAPDQSITAKVLGEKDSVSDQSTAIEDWEDNAPARGGRTAAIDAGKLAGLSVIDHGMPVHKTKTINDATAHVFHNSRSKRVASRALLATVTTRRSLQDVQVTCTLIATYNSNESVGRVCQLTNVLLGLRNLHDGEADVSATDVAVCQATRNKSCRTRVPSNRRLDMPDPFGIERSLQIHSTPPPTSTPAYGYIVFTTIGLELTCEQIATRLRGTAGVLSVDVDVGGTTVSDIGLYFVIILLKISRNLTPTPTQTTTLTVILNEIFLPYLTK
jgi:hypothetical protein